MLLDDLDWYWERTGTDLQVGLYQLAAMDVLGLKDVQVMYNVVRIPQQRKGRNESLDSYLKRIDADLAENPSSYFKRALISWSDSDLEELKEDLYTVSQDIWNNKQVDTWPRNRSACFEWKRKCPYYAACHEGKSINDETLYQVRARR